MKFINQIKKNPIKSIFLSSVLLVIGIFIYIYSLTSCFYLNMFSNKDLIKLLQNYNDKIFILNDSIKMCKNVEYNEFLLEAIKPKYMDYYGYKLIFKSSSLALEASYTLNSIYNKNMFYYDGISSNKIEGVLIEEKNKAIKETDETIKFWNEYLKDKK